MSETQSTAAAATTLTEAGNLGLLDQVLGATKQTERDRAQDLIKALTEEALKGTVTYSRNLTQTFERAIADLDALRLYDPVYGGPPVVAAGASRSSACLPPFT